MAIQINQPIIRAERQRPGFREIIHFRPRVAELTTAYGKRREKKSGRYSIGFVAMLVFLLAVVFIVSGCSSGSDVEAPADPIISCDSQGHCQTFPAGTSLNDINDAMNPPPAPPEPEPATPAELNEKPNGRAWSVTWAPGTLYSDSRGVCMLRYPYEPGPKPYNNILDFFGVCFSTGHHDWFFEIHPRYRSGNKWVSFDTGYFRGDLRLWQVQGGKLTGAFEVIADLADMVVGTHDYWNSNDKTVEIFWSNVQPPLPTYFGDPPSIKGNELTTLGDSTGVYGHARRAGGPVDLFAPFLQVGVPTSLEIRSDGSVYAQGSDGCVINGQSEDHFGGVWRGDFSNSCVPGQFSGFGATIGGRVYIGARAGWDKFVIVGER